MKIFRIFNYNLFFIFLFPFFVFGSTYNLVVGVLFKNEARWLQEWIEYHRILGVDHFYMYNNDSTDNYKEILKPYQELGIVDLIEWSSESAPFDDPRGAKEWVGFQHSAFNDCLRRVQGVSKWVAFVDIDEYLFSVGGINSFRNLLRDMPFDVGTIFVNWDCFGSSGIKEVPHDKLVIETFFRKGEEGNHYNFHGKCIHRPEALLYTLVHSAFLKDDYKLYHVSRKELRINHYLARGEDELIQKKRPGGIKELNVVFDDSMTPYISLVKSAKSKR